MKTSSIIVTGLILALAVTAAWRFLPKEPVGAMMPDEKELAKSTEPDAGPQFPGLTVGESGVEMEQETIAGISRRYLHVPDTRPVRDVNAPSTDERDITAENVDSLLLANLDHALQGDMGSAYFVNRTRMTCDGFADTPEELERSIRGANRRAERARQRGHSLPGIPEYDQPWSISSDPKANRVNMQRWYDACGRLRDIFTPDLRRRLEMLAQGGNVMARYLYAMWPEELLDAGEAFDRQFHWERQAREFSEANFHTGEVAGLMAFGQSYMTGTFTAQDRNLALAFGVAALNCGFETISIRSYLADSIDRLTNSNDPGDQQRLQFVLTESDRLGQFCTS